MTLQGKIDFVCMIAMTFDCMMDCNDWLQWLIAWLHAWFHSCNDCDDYCKIATRQTSMLPLALNKTAKRAGIGALVAAVGAETHLWRWLFPSCSLWKLAEPAAIICFMMQTDRHQQSIFCMSPKLQERRQNTAALVASPITSWPKINSHACDTYVMHMAQFNTHASQCAASPLCVALQACMPYNGTFQGMCVSRFDHAFVHAC